MIEWTDAERQAAGLIGQYEEIENTLVQNIAKRLQVGDPIGGTAEWQLKKLSDVGALTKENIKAIAKYSGRTVAEVEKVITDVGLASIAKDEKIYKEALSRGLLKTVAVPIDASDSVKQILQAAASNAADYLNLVNTTAIASAQSAYIHAVDQAYLEVSAGIYDYNTSIRRQVKALAEAGITGVKYTRKDGVEVNYPMDAAVRRAVLTSTAQTANRLQLQRASDYNAEYVEVSSHITARPSHAEWQGRVYKLNGTAKGYANFYDATHYGASDGLGGVNCRHSFYPYFMGISEQTYPHYDEAECRKAYDDSQVQRSYENQIRSLKRQAVAADAMGDKDTFDKASQALKQKQRDLNTFMRDTGREQTQRVGSVGYDRKVSGKSATAFNSIEVDGKKITVGNIRKAYNVTDDEARVILKAHKSVANYGATTGNEKVIAIDLTSGKRILTRTGSNNSVRFDASPLINASPNSVVVIHNHPRGSSFSAADVKVMNSYPSVRAIGVQGANGFVYTAAVENGRRISRGNLNGLDAIYDMLYNKHNNGTRSWVEVTHKTNTDVAKAFGWKYGRQKH